jgi:hypothetical protein
MRSARKVDNLKAVCERIVYKILYPRRLTTLWASTASFLKTAGKRAGIYTGIPLDIDLPIREKVDVLEENKFSLYVYR